MYKEKKYFDSDKLIDEVLKTELQYNLSDNFADKLAEKMLQRFAWQQYFAEFFIYLTAIIGLVAISITIQFVWFGAQWQDWLQFISQNISWIAGINFLLVFVLFADRVLLRYFMHQSQAQKA